MAESEELKGLLVKVKEESLQAALKLNFQKTKIMATSPITSRQIDGDAMETVTGYFWRAQKSLQMVTASMKLKTLAPWKKSYNHLDSILKSREITLPTKIRLVKL